MATSNFNFRGIPDEVMALLKKEAKKQHVSVNFLLLKLVEEGIGYIPKSKGKRHSDLDFLAGTWSEKEAKAFEKNVGYFEKVDDELWK